jgi:hypothetical protein
MTLDATELPPGPVREIKLQNPVRDNFAAYIFGNATKCQRVVEQNSAVGQHLVICGAGPSLRLTAPKWCPQGDQVWGCNSAVTWLYDNGHKVTHGFTVDQTAHMLEEWASAPPVDYIIASSCNPFLCEYLEGKGRAVTFFHNYVGVEGANVSYSVCKSCNAMSDRGGAACPSCQSTDIVSATIAYEEWLYAALYPSTMTVGSGLNATTRAIDLAIYMGFDKITLLGADCYIHATGKMPSSLKTGSPAHLAWLRANTTMHADGGHALASEASCLTLEGDIDGRHWLTKPDLMITAVWLVWMKRQYGSRLRIMGDTLPKALLDKPDSFLERLPMLTDPHGNAIKFTTPSEQKTGEGVLPVPPQ